MSKQLKKMSVQCTLKTMKDEETCPRNSASSENEMELKIQLDLAEKELSTLKTNMAALDEENETLHREMFLLENKVKEQDRLLKVMPEPCSPKAYYEDKIKEMVTEADKLRSKILDKDNELERVYAQLRVYKSCGEPEKRDLRKSRSLDSELESDFDVIVDLRRQLELSKQEVATLKETVTKLQEGTCKRDCRGDDDVDGVRVHSPDMLRGIAVAYVETEDEVKMRTKINLMEVSHRLLEENIEKLLTTILSFSRENIPQIYRKYIENISNSPEVIGSCRACNPGEVKNLSAELPNEPGNSCQTDVLKSSRSPGICSHMLNDSADDKCQQTNCLSRDPDRTLSIIEQAFCVIVKRLCEMDSENRKEVVLDSSAVTPEVASPSDMSSSQSSLQWETVSESSDIFDDYHSAKSDLSTPTNGSFDTPTNQKIESDGSLEFMTPTESDFISESLAYFDNQHTATEMLHTEPNNNLCEIGLTRTTEGIRTCENNKPACEIVHTPCETSNSASVLCHTVKADDNDSVRMLHSKIAYLEEEVGKSFIDILSSVPFLQSCHTYSKWTRPFFVVG